VSFKPPRSGSEPDLNADISGGGILTLRSRISTVGLHKVGDICQEVVEGANTTICRFSLIRK